MEIKINPSKANAYGQSFSRIKVWRSETELTLPNLGTLVYDSVFVPTINIAAPYVNKAFYIRIGYVTDSGLVYYSGNILLREPGPELKLALGNGARVLGWPEYGVWDSGVTSVNRPITSKFQEGMNNPLSFINTGVNLIYDDVDTPYAVTSTSLSRRLTAQDYYQAGFMAASGTNPNEWSGGMMGNIMGGEVEQGRYQVKQDITWNMRAPTLAEFRNKILTLMPTTYATSKRTLSIMNGWQDDEWWLTSDEYYGTFDSITGINNLGQTKPFRMDEVISFIPILTFAPNT